MKLEWIIEEQKMRKHFICFSVAYFNHFILLSFSTMNGLSLHFILMTMVTLKEINVLIINE